MDSSENQPTQPVPSRAAAKSGPAAGDTLGKYKLVGELGAGGMGKVFRAHDADLDREVALKVLPTGAGADEDSVRRFVIEARSIARISHPNVVAVYDVGEAGGVRYIAMELARGVSGAEMLKRNGPLDWKLAGRITADACRGLGEAHGAGIIHRDVKPANLLCAPDGATKVVDFGLAKAAEGNTQLTGTGMVLCTPEFMSPEQAETKPLDHRTDLYSLGATYFALLTGRSPFAEPGASTAQLMFSHVFKPAPDPRSLRPDLPAGCSRIIAKALAKVPAERYQSAAEMIADLEAVAAGTFAASAQPGAGPRMLPLVAGAAAAVLIGIGIWLAFGGKAKDDGAGKSEQHSKSDAPPVDKTERPGRKEFANGLGMTFVHLPAGRFVMGSDEEKSERPAHEVRLTRGFYMSVHPVTVGQWRKFAASGYKSEAELDGGAEPRGADGYDPDDMWYVHKKQFNWQHPGFTQTDDHPVVCLSWNDAQEFCRWLGKQDGRTYRLPTEAEWEYACRAGTATAWWTGDEVAGLKGAANLLDQSAAAVLDADSLSEHGGEPVGWNDGRPFTSPVGAFKANPWGLHDMHGNVWQWCEDRWGPNYYAASPPADPVGPAVGPDRVLRGGSWIDAPADCRSASRYHLKPTSRELCTGFRVVADK